MKICLRSGGDWSFISGNRGSVYLRKLSTSDTFLATLLRRLSRSFFIFLLYFSLTLYLQLRPGLKHHRYDDECDAEDKREVQLLVFVENNHGDNDAVNRFQIVCEVDREGVNLL